MLHATLFSSSRGCRPADHGLAPVARNGNDSQWNRRDRARPQRAEQTRPGRRGTPGARARIGKDSGPRRVENAADAGVVDQRQRRQDGGSTGTGRVRDRPNGAIEKNFRAAQRAAPETVVGAGVHGPTLSVGRIVGTRLHDPTDRAGIVMRGTPATAGVARLPGWGGRLFAATRRCAGRGQQRRAQNPHAQKGKRSRSTVAARRIPGHRLYYTIPPGGIPTSRHGRTGPGPSPSAPNAE